MITMSQWPRRNAGVTCSTLGAASVEGQIGADSEIRNRCSVDGTGLTGHYLSPKGSTELPGARTGTLGAQRLVKSSGPSGL